MVRSFSAFSFFLQILKKRHSKNAPRSFQIQRQMIDHSFVLFIVFFYLQIILNVQIRAKKTVLAQEFSFFLLFFMRSHAESTHAYHATLGEFGKTIFYTTSIRIRQDNIMEVSKNEKAPNEGNHKPCRHGRGRGLPNVHITT